ncbi:alphaN-acetylglucosamine transferase [Histoplasma capsulatum H143]|uniref:AlphaN-acetylglucosamine transferase n=1 Tax=Ajellomyces capsulatus (strain H143) TaxID=544712 RepID=C6H6I6_AJECH|nr:alphaN-acetylglucosamine transferase [Histoplasma capsulatum H143]
MQLYSQLGNNICSSSWKPRFASRVLLRPRFVRDILIIFFVVAACQLLWVYLLPLPQPSAPVVIDNSQEVEWSRFAYAQYATDPVYLCNSLMIFETLQRLQTKPDRILMYPNRWPANTTKRKAIERMLAKARDEYNVKLKPISPLQASPDVTWGDSFTKLLAFNLTEYERILILDSDSTILQSMDELFLLPSAPVAMPRAYWLQSEDNFLTSGLVVLEPSEFQFSRIINAISEKDLKEYDMELMNRLYQNHCLILPHRPYFLISGEFRGDNHLRYLGSDNEVWDPQKVFAEAKIIHFSDWPYPKPWRKASKTNTDRRMPNCSIGLTGEEDCRGRDIWLSLYEDFRERRKNICGPRI